MPTLGTASAAAATDFATAAQGTKADAAVRPTALADASLGNDTADAKTHFQSKMDALSAAGGGLLHIPRGTYRTSGPLYVPSNVTLRGEGTATVVKATFSGAGVIYSSGASGNTNITVSDLTVDGNNSANQGVAFAGVKHGTIHNVRIMRCTGYGVWVCAAGEVPGSSQGTPSEQVTVSACHITDVTDTGIETSYVKGVTVLGCTVEGTTGRAYYAWAGSQDVTFTGNVAVGVGTNTFIGFQVAGLGDTSMPNQTARVAFVGNAARNVLQGVKASGSVGNIPTDVSVIGNTLHTALGSSNGIYLDFVTRFMARDNHVEGFTTPLRVADPGVGTFGSVVAPTLSGNRIYNCGSSVLLRGNVRAGQRQHRRRLDRPLRAAPRLLGDDRIQQLVHRLRRHRQRLGDRPERPHRRPLHR